MTNVPRQRTLIVASIVVAAAAACGFMLALQRGTVWAAAGFGGVIVGLQLAVAWITRRSTPRVSALLVGGAAVPAALLGLVSPVAGVWGIAIAAGVLALWMRLAPSRAFKEEEP